MGTDGAQLAYVCRCGARFNRGPKTDQGGGIQGEQEYLHHIGFGGEPFLGSDFFRRVKYWRSPSQLPVGCSQVTDLFPASAQALLWYGRHRAIIENINAAQHPDAEVRRLTAILEQRTSERDQLQIRVNAFIKEDTVRMQRKEQGL